MSRIGSSLVVSVLLPLTLILASTAEAQESIEFDGQLYSSFGEASLLLINEDQLLVSGLNSEADGLWVDYDATDNARLSLSEVDESGVLNLQTSGTVDGLEDRVISTSQLAYNGSSWIYSVNYPSFEQITYRALVYFGGELIAEVDGLSTASLESQDSPASIGFGPGPLTAAAKPDDESPCSSGSSYYYYCLNATGVSTNPCEPYFGRQQTAQLAQCCSQNNGTKVVRACSGFGSGCIFHGGVDLLLEDHIFHTDQVIFVVEDPDRVGPVSTQQLTGDSVDELLLLANP